MSEVEKILLYERRTCECESWSVSKSKTENSYRAIDHIISKSQLQAEENFLRRLQGINLPHKKINTYFMIIFVLNFPFVPNILLFSIWIQSQFEKFFCMLCGYARVVYSNFTWFPPSSLACDFPFSWNFLHTFLFYSNQIQWLTSSNSSNSGGCKLSTNKVNFWRDDQVKLRSRSFRFFVERQTNKHKHKINFLNVKFLKHEKC